MSKPINVLSLFDGMGCGMIALKELGVEIGKYYASEIDESAIKQVKYNFPAVVHLGDVKNIDVSNLESIDLLIGGSPCQGFSFIGKHLNFDDPRSRLFFEFVRIWEDVKRINPEAKFLLENVNMKKKHLGVISSYLNLFPISINSNLVSAQNRQRWYWSNIKTRKSGLFNEDWTAIPRLEDRGVFIKDIIKPTYGPYMQVKVVRALGADNVFSIKEQRTKEAKEERRRTGRNKFRDKEMIARTDGKIGCLLTSLSKDHLIYDGVGYRYITANEASILQTIPDWYKWVVSDSEKIKQLGNGWTIEVIKHILKYL